MGAFIIGFGIIGVWITAVIGWIINLIDVVQLAIANSPLTTLFVAKIIGIVVAPLGAILGIFA